jgi:hypothetical protein
MKDSELNGYEHSLNLISSLFPLECSFVPLQLFQNILTLPCF